MNNRHSQLCQTTTTVFVNRWFYMTEHCRNISPAGISHTHNSCPCVVSLTFKMILCFLLTCPWFCCLSKKQPDHIRHNKAVSAFGWLQELPFCSLFYIRAPQINYMHQSFVCFRKYNQVSHRYDKCRGVVVSKLGDNYSKIFYANARIVLSTRCRQRHACLQTFMTQNRWTKWLYVSNRIKQKTSEYFWFSRLCYLYRSMAWNEEIKRKGEHILEMCIIITF